MNSPPKPGEFTPDETKNYQLDTEADTTKRQIQKNLYGIMKKTSTLLRSNTRRKKRKK